MIRKILYGFLAIGQIAIVAPAVTAAVLQAGVARIDLTPSLEMKAALGGYGERMSRPAEGVHDRIFAKAVVLRQGSKRFALVTADILGFPPPVKRAIVERLAHSGWTDAQIMLLPSHSHTSIDMMQIHPGNLLPIPQLGLFRRRVHEWTVERIAEVIRQASANPTPCLVGTAQIEIAGWNTNRRHDDGAVDNQLTVTRIDRHDGKPLAVWVSWTAHPTFMSADDMWFSGGWPGHLQRTLEALIGNGVTVLYYNGAEGDQRPLARPDSGASRWERAERYGRELALVVHRAFQRIRPRTTDVFQYHLQRIELPQRIAHPQFMQTGGAEYGLQGALMEKLLSTLVPDTTESGSVRLGDLVIVGIPGELAAELGLSIKQQTATITAARYVAIGGLANEWVSYILPSAEYEQGGYEASVSFYGASLGKTIVAGAINGVKQLSTSATD